MEKGRKHSGWEKEADEEEKGQGKLANLIRVVGHREGWKKGIHEGKSGKD